VSIGLTKDGQIVGRDRYEITYKPMARGEPDAFLDGLARDERERLFALVHEDPAAAIERLEAERRKGWTPNPVMLNWLVSAYQLRGELDKSDAVAEENYRRHPEYLFARIAWANICINNGNLDEVDTIFGGKYELSVLYPDRKLFHVSEYIPFTHLMVIYYVGRGKPDVARIYFSGMEEIDPDGPATAAARRLLDGKAVRVLSSLQKVLRTFSRGR
jgi:hypothetical protein